MRPHAAIVGPERRSFASMISASDCGMPGAHIDKGGLELEIGFGDFEHLAASLFAFSAMVEICRDDRICRQGANAKIADESRDSLIGAKISLIGRFNSL
jgi:hypothetical protein